MIDKSEDDVRSVSDFYSLTVQDVINETPESKSFVLKPQRGETNLFRYQPGQFLSFQIPYQSGLIERSYSISSAPCFDPDITICVKRVKNGRGSNWFNDHLKIGAAIKSRLPSGRFILDNNQTDLFVIAGGSGITPCISLIKHSLFETARKVKLIYANQNSQSIIYADVINTLLNRFSERFEYICWLDNESGFMSEKDIVSLACGDEKSSCYICGPAQLMDMAEDVLTQSFGEQANIKTERFVSPDDAVDSQKSDSIEYLKNDLLNEFRLQYEGEIHTVGLAKGQTLLQAALACNLDIPRSCTEGHCGTCIAKLCEGEVSMVSTKALSKRSIERGHILLCQSHPGSDKPLFVNLDF